MTAAAADFDGDGWVDIYVACDSTAAILYKNGGDGTFSDVAVRSGAAFDGLGNAQAGMGLAVNDYDRDGRLDLVKTHFADDIPALYRNLGRGQFEDVAVPAGLGVENRHVEWGAGLPDLDNDGWPDLLYVTGNVYPEIERVMPQYPHRGPRVVFRNRGGRFRQVTDSSGPAPRAARSSRGAAFGDFDNDGDLDVLVMNMNEPPSLLRNDYKGRTAGSRSAWSAALQPNGPRRDRGRGLGQARGRPRRCSASRATTPTTTCGCTSASGSARRRTRSRCAGRAARWTCCEASPVGVSSSSKKARPDTDRPLHESNDDHCISLNRATNGWIRSMFYDLLNFFLTVSSRHS